MSQEFQIIEGGVGDYISVAGFTESGEQIRPSLTTTIRKDRDGETRLGSQRHVHARQLGPRQLVGTQRRLGGQARLPGAEGCRDRGIGWTRLEAIVNGASLQYDVNGQLVFEATSSSLTEGKIMIQSEGAEIYFRTGLRSLEPP